MKQTRKRWLSLLLAIVFIFGTLPGGAISADGEPTTEPTPIPTETPEPTPVPTETPEPTPVPTETPEPTPAPTETPEPTPVPTETPEPTPVPTEMPVPTPVPTVTPVPTPEPVEELVFKLGDGEKLTITIGGSFDVDTRLSIREPYDYELEWMQEKVEKRLKRHLDDLVGVRLIDEDGKPAALKQEGMTFKFEGKILPDDEETEFLFMLFNENANAFRPADVKKIEPEDGTPIYYTFRSDVVSSIFIATPNDEPWEEEDDEAKRVDPNQTLLTTGDGAQPLTDTIGEGDAALTVTVTGAPDGAALTLTQADGNSEAVRTAMDGEYDVLFALDISLGEATLADPVQISVSGKSLETIPEGARLVHIVSGQGEILTFEPVADENAISFTTSSCSPFILAAPKADPKPTDGEDRSETGDATINKYHVKWDFKWVNGSSGSAANYEYKNPVTGAADSNYLFFHPQTWNYQNANLMVELTFSGTQDDSIPAGSIEIRIPVSIFSGWRTGNPADSIVTQVPLAPATNAQSNFNYYVDTETNELVIKNFNMISGNDYLSVEFSYKVSPLDVKGGYPDEAAARAAGFVDPVYGLGAEVGAKDIDRFCWNHGGQYLWKDYYTNEGINCKISLDPDLDGKPDYYDYDNPLSVAMMTRAGGTSKSFVMPDQRGGVYTAWQSTWGPKPADAADYIYVVWNVNYTTLYNFNDNQPYRVDIAYDKDYPAITFSKEGKENTVIYGQQVGSMMHTWTTLGGASFWSNLTVWGGDGSRGYYPGLGTDTTNTEGKNNYIHLFWSKFGELFHGYKTGQGIFYGTTINTYDDGHQASLPPNFAVLVKYPINEILNCAKEYGVDMEHTGIRIYGQYIATESWESGYKIDRISRNVAELYLVDRSGVGVFTKRHRAENFDSNVTEGAQTVLSDGTQVDLARETFDGFIRYPWYISYNGTSPYRTTKTTDEEGNEVETSALIPQRLVLEEVQMMLSSAGAKSPRGWQTNTDTPSARPIGTGYNGDGNVFLTDEDYTIPRFDVQTFQDYAGEYAAGVWAEAGLLDYTKVKPLFIYIRYAGTSEYVPYCAAVMTSQTGFTVWKCDPTALDDNGFPVIYRNNANKITPSDHHYALPAGVTGIRWEHETTELVYRTSVNVTVHAIIKPTEKVKACVDADLNHLNADGVLTPVNTYIKNIAKYAVYDEKADGSGWESSPRLSGDNYAGGKGVAESVIWILTRVTNSMSISKDTYVPPDDAPAQIEAGHNNMEIGYVKLQMRNDAGINKNIVRSTDAEDAYKPLTGTFYELLPKGTNIRADSVFGVYNETWSSHQGSAQTYTSWRQYKDRGSVVDTQATDGKRYFLGADDYSVSTEYIPELDQTLVRIDYSFADPRINQCFDNTWYCFVAFYFIVENPYQNIRARGTSTQNYVAFENRTEGCHSAVSSGSAITAAHLSNNQAIADMFNSHITPGNNGRAGCAAANMNWNVVTVLEAGYTKTVATPETLNGLPQAENYVSDGGRVTVNNRYIYRLQLTNMPTTRADHIVLYDIIETGTVSEETAWHGKFVSVDTSLIAATPTDGSKTVRCDPVVYYSTTLKDKVDIGLSGFNVDDSSVWSTTCPDDPSTVTAIAIDCRKATDGSDFHLSQKGTLTAFIQMQAPGEMVKDSAGNIDVDAMTINGSVAAIRPYNEKPGDTDVKDSWLMSRASVQLRDTDVSLIKQSDPKTGTPEARTIVDSDGTGTIVYRLRVRNTMPFDCNDVVLTDPIPEHLTFDKVTVKLNGSSSETDGDSTPGFAYELAEDGRSFTFRIAHQHPTVIEKGTDEAGAETETVKTDKDTYIYIYTIVDKLVEQTTETVVDEDGNETEVTVEKQVFLRDYDNTATLVSANGKDIGEDTETMYHRAETTRIGVTKTWEDANDRYRKRPERVAFDIVCMVDMPKVTGQDEDGNDIVEIVPTDVSDLMGLPGFEITPDEDGNWSASVENLPKYYVLTEDASFDVPNTWYEIHYALHEQDIFDPNDESEDKLPIYTPEYGTVDPDADGHGYVTTVKNDYGLRYGSLKIVKSLPIYECAEDASFAFDIVGKIGERVVYSNVAMITLSEAGTGTTIIHNLPAGIDVTVTEVGSGNSHYTQIEANGTATIVADETVTVNFTNTYNTNDRGGHGVINMFSLDGDNGWHWTKGASTPNEPLVVPQPEEGGSEA